MSEKAKFHNMTKPIRFRWLKLAKQIFADWCWSFRDVITYNFNYLLYKLNILKRYSYRDMVEQVISLDHKHPKLQVAKSDTFKGVVKMCLINETHYDIDYFYRQKKNGEKKITLTLKNEEENRVFFESHLEDVCLFINDRWYEPYNLPTLKVATFQPPKASFCGREDVLLNPVEYDTVTYDLLPIKTLKFQSFVGKMQLSDVSEPMIHYYYNIACEGFIKKLNSMNIHDLMIK